MNTMMRLMVKWGGERSAEVVNREALRWLEKHKNDKFFLFIHYFDPHGPYEAPSPYDKSFSFTNDSLDITKIPPYQVRDNISDPSFYIAQYDGEIKYTDYHISKLLHVLSDAGLMSNTLVVLTSDHGETMNEHSRWFDHGGFVYDEQIHIPLILKYPKLFGKGRIEHLTRHIDILPTILDILGIEFEQGIEGNSLLSLMKGEGEGVKFVYSESGRGDATRNKGGIEGIEGKMFSLRSREWKLIRSPKEMGIEYELYNLMKDKRELHNLAGKNLPAENDLRIELDDYVERYKKLFLLQEKN